MTYQASIAVPAVRRDGWTAARTTQFLDHLANDGSVRAACARVGMSREAAYQLRRRDALFARTWNAALVLAREASAEVLEERAIHGVVEEIWFRGELAGTRRRFDSRLLLAHMARLDRIAGEGEASRDAARFDELLALAGGQPAADGCECDEDGVPFDREIEVEMAVDDAASAFHEAWIAEQPDSDDEGMDLAPESGGDDPELTFEAYHAGLSGVKWRAGLLAGSAWDERRALNHAAVDRLLEAPVAEPGTVSGLSTSAPATSDPVASKAAP